MQKTAFAIKLDSELLKNVKGFCDTHGIKYSFFVEKALKNQLEKEELKEDIFDLKQLVREENEAVPFEEYLRNFKVWNLFYTTGNKRYERTPDKYCKKY